VAPEKAANALDRALTEVDRVKVHAAVKGVVNALNARTIETDPHRRKEELGIDPLQMTDVGQVDKSLSGYTQRRPTVERCLSRCCQSTVQLERLF
jgi:hypothetical protein